MTRNSARPAVGSGTGGATNGYAGGESFSLRIARPRNPRPTTIPIYSPLTDARKCGQCGRRDQWRRVMAIGGGWTCCGYDAGQEHHSDLGHQCGPRCVLAVPA